MLSDFYAECCHAECHYAAHSKALSRNAECSDTVMLSVAMLIVSILSAVLPKVIMSGLVFVENRGAEIVAN